MKILAKKFTTQQDLARSCQEIQEIPRFLSRVSRKVLDDHGLKCKKTLTFVYFGMSNALEDQ